MSWWGIAVHGRLLLSRATVPVPEMNRAMAQWVRHWLATPPVAHTQAVRQAVQLTRWQAAQPVTLSAAEADRIARLSRAERPIMPVNIDLAHSWGRLLLGVSNSPEASLAAGYVIEPQAGQGSGIIADLENSVLYEFAVLIADRQHPLPVRAGWERLCPGHVQRRTGFADL